MVSYRIFGVFFILVHYYFQVSFNLKAILYVAEIPQNNTVIDLLSTEALYSSTSIKRPPSGKWIVAV